MPSGLRPSVRWLLQSVGCGNMMLLYAGINMLALDAIFFTIAPFAVKVAGVISVVGESSQPATPHVQLG